MSGSDQWMQGDPEKERIRREEELYKQEVMKLEKDLSYVHTFSYFMEGSSKRSASSSNS